MAAAVLGPQMRMPLRLLLLALSMTVCGVGPCVSARVGVRGRLLVSRRRKIAEETLLGRVGQFETELVDEESANSGSGSGIGSGSGSGSGSGRVLGVGGGSQVLQPRTDLFPDPSPRGDGAYGDWSGSGSGTGSSGGGCNRGGGEWRRSRVRHRRNFSWTGGESEESFGCMRLELEQLAEEVQNHDHFDQQQQQQQQWQQEQQEQQQRRRQQQEHQLLHPVWQLQGNLHSRKVGYVQPMHLQQVEVTQQVDIVQHVPQQLRLATQQADKSEQQGSIQHLTEPLHASSSHNCVQQQPLSKKNHPQPPPPLYQQQQLRQQQQRGLVFERSASTSLMSMVRSLRHKLARSGSRWSAEADASAAASTVNSTTHVDIVIGHHANPFYRQQKQQQQQQPGVAMSCESS